MDVNSSLIGMLPSNKANTASADVLVPYVSLSHRNPYYYYITVTL